MCKELIEIQKKLIELTNRWMELSQHGKIGEPSISIGIDNEMKWFAEIYSYQMDFHDGGRHHHFEANTFEELIKKIWVGIKEEEKILESVEKESDKNES